MKHFFTLALVYFSISQLYGQSSFEVTSPNGKVQLTVETEGDLRWSARISGQAILAPSQIGMTLTTGEVLGAQPKIVFAKTEKISTTISAINYKKKIVRDAFTQLLLKCKGNYTVVFRAYDDGIAYRFILNRKDSVRVKSELAEFNFAKDHFAYVPYNNDPHNNDVFECSFENNYTHEKISEIKKDTLAFAPIMVECAGGIKAVISEADLESYPGMFLSSTQEGFGFKGVFAPFPVREKQGGHNNLQSFVIERADFIAKVPGKKNFPWRFVVLSEKDSDLLDNDMVYKLASPSRIKDVSWIKPGKVAWDWWNDWNISGVDFKAGINTATYKYYIDFASANKIEYVLLDEGWATSEDIMKIVPEIDLKEIIEYGRERNVGIWLWGGWLPLSKQIDLALSTYSKLGVKGFKVDFMDRDDQKMVDFFYTFARKAAAYNLMVDFHGAYKPTGLQRTCPNVMTFEGVRGLENVKWSNTDFPLYDCSIPFIRMIAGPMDYTPGAMKNANRHNFRPIHSTPMSQGTRCHQLALYVLYESPFSMLADNPTNYLKEQESTTFISSIPTVFDETVALDGKVGEFAAVARKSGENWYIGAITNWDARPLSIDLSFLGNGDFEAEIFQDGVNADREGSDYKRIIRKVNSKDILSISMAGGGGWAARIYPASQAK